MIESVYYYKLRKIVSGGSQKEVMSYLEARFNIFFPTNDDRRIAFHALGHHKRLDWRQAPEIRYIVNDVLEAQRFYADNKEKVDYVSKGLPYQWIFNHFHNLERQLYADHHNMKIWDTK